VDARAIDCVMRIEVTPHLARGRPNLVVFDEDVGLEALARFTYAVNPMMVGNLSDTPFDGQSAILERRRRGARCNYVGDRAFVPREDDPELRAYAGAKPQFLALAPWVAPHASRDMLRPIGAALAVGRGDHHYVETALISDLTFPADLLRAGCLMAGR